MKLEMEIGKEWKSMREVECRKWKVEIEIGKEWKPMKEEEENNVQRQVKKMGSRVAYGI